LKISKVNWDKKKHGLVWHITDVFNNDELDYIHKRISKEKLILPPSNKPEAAYRGEELPLINKRVGPVLKKLYPHLQQEYKDAQIELLYKDNCNAADLVCNIDLQGTAQSINYRIHTDVVEKLLTFLVYIHPKIQEPTYFHAYKKGKFLKDKKYKENDTDPIQEIPWKVNTGYIFLANEFSYHSYANTIYNTDRHVVIGHLRKYKL
jgi:hypothetical protein